MEHNRYGKLYWRDYKSTWAVIGGMCLFAAACFSLNLSILYCVLPVFFSAIWIALIFFPYMERFTICDDSILIHQMGRISKVPLPPNIVLVFSPADIRDTFSVQSYLLKNKFAVSILHKVSLEETMQVLHANHVKKYTNSTIEAKFYDSFVYSFVYEQESLAQILKHGVSMVIIPESLADRIDFKVLGSCVLIDSGF